MGKTKAKGNVGSGGISLTIRSVPDEVKVELYAPYNRWLFGLYSENVVATVGLASSSHPVGLRVHLL